MVYNQCMKNIAIKILKITLILLIVTVVSLHSIFFYKDKKNNDFIQGWLEDNEERHHKIDWEDGFYSRVLENDYIKLIRSDIYKQPYFLLISHTKSKPSSVSELYLYENKEGVMYVALWTYFPYNCSPNSVLKSAKRYSTGEAIALECLKNGKWISTGYATPLKDTFFREINLLGFNEIVSLSYSKMNLLKREHAVYSAVQGESPMLIGYSKESRANNALTCAGLFYILTANPEPKELNLLSTNAAIMMSSVYAHLEGENSEKSLTNGDISNAKDNRALELGRFYEKNPDGLVKIYAQCVEISKDIAIHIENNTPESGSLDWMERRDMYLATPSANKIEEIDDSTFNVYKNQIDSAMTSWSALDKITYTDFKKALLDSLKK